MSWDVALSETETGDYSACAVLLKRGDRYHVLEVMRGRWRFDELKRRVIESRRRYNARLVIEDSPISKGLIQSVREQNINIVDVKPTTDKRARVIAQTDLFAGGSITFQAGEHATQPNQDDRVAGPADVGLWTAGAGARRQFCRLSACGIAAAPPPRE